MPHGARVFSREGEQDTGVGRSSSIWPNSGMQYKDPLEPPKVAPVETSRNQRKLVETGGNQRKTDMLFYPVKHFFTVLQNKFICCCLVF